MKRKSEEEVMKKKIPRQGMETPAAINISSPALPCEGCLTDVGDLKVGHFTDPRRPTGCTVILAEAGAVAGVDVRGSAPGTRETDLLHPVRTVEKIHAILLTGGSAFGLDAASGVVRFLEERSIGFPVGSIYVPIVPAAVLFDLAVGDGHIRPDSAAGYTACVHAVAGAVAEGNVGAGAGATVGKLFGFSQAMKAGIGTCCLQSGELKVGALVAVNAVGDIRDPQSGRLLAGARTPDGKGLIDTTATLLRNPAAKAALQGANTTIGVIAVNAALDKAGMTKIAQMGHDGLARTIYPAHTAMDGDTLFALCNGRIQEKDLTLIGTLAAEAVARAVIRAVLTAEGIAGYPAACDLLSDT